VQEPGEEVLNKPAPLIAMNANDPVDIAAMLCMCTVDFFKAHMEPKTAQDKHANFLASIEDVLLSEEGKRYLHSGWEKYLKLVEDAG
jgi:hypothetical protein